MARGDEPVGERVHPEGHEHAPVDGGADDPAGTQRGRADRLAAPDHRGAVRPAHRQRVVELTHPRPPVRVAAPAAPRR